MKRLSRDSRGFTITETMIVLAIAGLILLLVFEAIPALERSSRNNQRRQDVQTILAAVSHYELNDSGNFPENCGGAAPAPACTTADGNTTAYPNDYFLKTVAGKITFYDSATPSALALQGLPATTGCNEGGADPGGCPGATDPDKVIIYNHQKCNQDGSSTEKGAGYNDVVALFAVEEGTSGHQAQCQQL